MPANMSVTIRLRRPWAWVAMLAAGIGSYRLCRWAVAHGTVVEVPR